MPVEPDLSAVKGRLYEHGKLGVVVADHVLEPEDLAGVDDLDAAEGIRHLQVAGQRIDNVDGGVIPGRQLRVGGLQDELQDAGGEERQAGHYPAEGHAVEGVL